MEDAEQLKKEVDYLLYEMLQEDREEKNIFYNRITKTKKYIVFYMKLARLHIVNNDWNDLKWMFYMKENLKTEYCTVHRLIDFLKKEGLCVIRNNPLKTKKNRQMVGLRNPEIHKELYSRIKKAIKVNPK